ncbi:MAG TPA: hypothetical protein VH253_04020 [Phycisphaerae bacterium]|nr:hypothetical protein [Phycisphaerae bacterium]
MEERPDLSADEVHADAQLSAEDAAALDALLEQRAAAPDTDRQARVRALLAALDRLPQESPPADLADRTLAAIRADRMKLAAHATSPSAPATPAAAATRRRWRIGLKEAAAMATAAAILVVVLIPALAQARQSARRVACAANLAIYSSAFGAYADANGNALPSLGQPANHSWLDDGKGRNNDDNLLPLVRGTYITADRLACPGRDKALILPPGATHIPDEGRGYSYTNLVANPHQHWDGSAETLLLADRNPLFDPAAGASATPDMNSCNHGGHGTYVLAADGSAVQWQPNPNIGPKGDNIWTVGPTQAPRIAYAGTESAAPGDAFLAP